MDSRQSLDVDIVCVGFGPASGGFLTTLARGLAARAGTPAAESRATPGLPLQVMAFERADDIGAGVSGVVTRARGIRRSFPDLDLSQIPMAAPVGHERVTYLLDPIGASRRSSALRACDATLRATRGFGGVRRHALELPYIPGFLRKDGGLILSLGQFMQWVGGQIMATGAVQLWPASPIARALIEGEQVVGVRLLDQGTTKDGQPAAGFMPGMDVHAALTVVGDGPVGSVGRQLDEHFGMPEGRRQRDWAVGMKMVVELPDSSGLDAGAVLHTFGYPEPEIFGFLYVNDARTATVGIFVPSWFDSPVRTSYRYLQHWMLHPAIWPHLAGGRLRSWGAKSLQESGKQGEPHLAGPGYVRIGEGSGTTNVLTGSGVDEAWTTGVQLGESVLELLDARAPLTRENLERTYVHRRRASWVESEARAAERARNGFHRGVLTGLAGMALAGLTRGRLAVPSRFAPHRLRVRSLEDYVAGRLSDADVERLRRDAAETGEGLHDAVMDRCGWPAIPHDGQLLVSHQDALLMGGKVQAAPGFADHVIFEDPALCRECRTRLCVEMCSGQAIALGPDLVPVFDRDKCIHCGACHWNCEVPAPGMPSRPNLSFRAGAGGLHSTEN
jgi:electron-transferring-flavoprotein dehydrogenase